MTTKIESIILPKMTTPNRPINIASDPRVFRGSIIAKQREALRQIQQVSEPDTKIRLHSFDVSMMPGFWAQKIFPTKATMTKWISGFFGAVNKSEDDRLISPCFTGNGDSCSRRTLEGRCRQKQIEFGFGKCQHNGSGPSWAISGWVSIRCAEHSFSLKLILSKPRRNAQ